MGVLNFHLIAQLRVGPASPGLRPRDAAKLFHFLRRAGHVKDKAVRFVANIVVDDFQHVDVTLIAHGIYHRIFKGGFALPLRLIHVLNGLLSAKLALRDAPVGRERQRLRPELAHFVAPVDPDEVIAWRKIGQLVAQRRGILAFRQRLNASFRDAQQQRQTEVAAREGNGVFIPIDGEVLHLFREVPQADDVWFPGENFFLHVEEHFRQGLPRQRAAAQANKVVAAQNVQHGGAVIHGVAFGGDLLLLRLVAAQDEEQVAAILLVELIPRAVFHRQMVR